MYFYTNYKNVNVCSSDFLSQEENSLEKSLNNGYHLNVSVNSIQVLEYITLHY